MVLEQKTEKIPLESIIRFQPIADRIMHSETVEMMVWLE